MESVIRCPLGIPMLTSIPLRIMNGFFADALVSISGTSACQPLRSFPLKRLIVLYCWDLQEKLNAISIATTIFDRIVNFYRFKNIFENVLDIFKYFLKKFFHRIICR